MKKILLLLPGLILIPFSAFAISLSEIQSDPGRYVKVAEGQNYHYVCRFLLHSITPLCSSLLYNSRKDILCLIYR